MIDVNQDTGELNVDKNVALDAIMIYVTRKEDAPVRIGIGEGTDATNVNVGIGELIVDRNVAMDVEMYVTEKENVPVRLSIGQDMEIEKRNGQERNVINVNQDTGELIVDKDVAINVVVIQQGKWHVIK